MWNSKIFILLTSWVLLVSVSAISNFISISKEETKLAKTQAKAFFDEIVTARSWNANHGGVYVKVTDRMQPNPYLKVPNRDLIIDSLDLKLTLVDPAFMTRQISELADKKANYKYHMTSLNPIRPNNKADEWEKIQLQNFENGNLESFELIKSKSIYRYMAPLMVESACLKCHEYQGYKEGDVRGGISVNIPAQSFSQNAFTQKRNIVFIHFIILLIGILGIMAFQRNTYNFMNRIQSVYKIIRKQNAELHLKQKILNESNKQLTEINNTKDLLFSIIAHDLKNPFVALLGLANYSIEMLESKDYKDLEEVNRLIFSTTEKTFYLLKNLLEWSRLQSGKISYNPSYCNLNKLLSDVSMLYKNIAKQKNVEIKNNINQDLTVFCDEKMIETILRNLISNAIKYTNKNGEVSMDYKIENNFTIISVSDNGVGITKEDQQKLFKLNSFHTSLGTNDEKGTGLGLILVKDFIELHNGKVWIESEINVGTTVHFSLPNKNIAQSFI